VILVVFWPLAGYDSVDFDDPDFVTAHPQGQRGMTWESVMWAFRPGHGDYCRPLSAGQNEIAAKKLKLLGLYRSGRAPRETPP
jgi:hypothetical protein